MPPLFNNPFDPSFTEEDVERLTDEARAFDMPEDYEVTEREIERLYDLAHKYKAPVDVVDEETALVAIDWLLEQGIPLFAAELEPNEWLPESQIERIEEGDLVSYGQLLQGRRRIPHALPIYLIEETAGSDYEGGTVALSNYQVLREMAYGDLDDVRAIYTNNQLLFQEYLIFISGVYGTRGVALRLDKGPIPRELLDAVEAMESYPILDEDHHSQLEMEIIDEDWPEAGRADWRIALMEAFPDHAEDIEDFDVSDLDDLWGIASPDLSESPRIEGMDAVIYPFDEAVGLLDESDILEIVEGLDR
jgi:hypothetical protein